MSDVKLVISHLCKVLNGLFNENIRPEQFRLAKFNKSSENVVAHLWRVAHKLCCPVTYGACREDGGEGSVCKFDTVNCVKLALASLQYDSVAFYSLPADMSAGSRELLLAVGWLLATTGRLEARVRRCASDSVFQSEYCSSASAKAVTGVAASKVADLEDEGDLLNYIDWVSGRIKHNVKLIINMTAELVKLTSQVHSATEGVYGLPHLSVAELSMVRDQHVNPLVLSELKASVTVLENYLHWRKKRKVFWEWMESVLREETDSTAEPVNTGKDMNSFIKLLREEIKKEIMKDRCVERELANGSGRFNCRMLYGGGGRSGGSGECSSDQLAKLISKVDAKLERLKQLRKVKAGEIDNTMKMILNEDCAG